MHNIFNDINRSNPGKPFLERLRKIVFISPRPFGLMGTPGTYLLTESYSKYVDVCVISNQKTNCNNPIVYQSGNRSNIYEINFSKKTFIFEAEPIIRKFQPDLIIIGNYSRWYEISADIKSKFPQAIIILDIKSPLIVDDDTKLYDHIQRKGDECSFLLELVMTRCLGDVDTWVPHCTTPVLEYPLGVRTTDYIPTIIKDKSIQCSKFVYVGALHERRKLDAMIRYISLLPEDLRSSLKFDFYGSGPALDGLVKLSKKLGLEKIISFKGFVDSESLARVLSDYDAGVAWVPHEVYNDAPSLKLMEYLAAGLVPIATDTAAHVKYGEKGFHIEFFSDSAESFEEVIRNLNETGFHVDQREENLQNITNYDWDRITSQVILPAFAELVDGRSEIPPAHASSIYDRVLMWDIPAIPEEIVPVYQSDLKVAAILSDRLCRGLDPDCDLYLLTPQNWTFVLEHARPDFVLMESTWASATGNWYMAQSVASEEHDILRGILRAARQAGVPSVFWMTMDQVYFEHFKDIVNLFDYVFCADPSCVDLFAKVGVKAELLLPAVQPVIFNPILNVENNTPFTAGTLFNGWVDLFKIPSLSPLLKKLTPVNLNIFQTNLMMYKGQLERTDGELKHYVRGTVLDALLPILLRNADMYLSFEKSSRTRTHLLWDVMEAAASRLPVAWLGRGEDDELLSKVARPFEKESDFTEYVLSSGSGNLDVERDRHRAWREVHLNNIFPKRLEAICRNVGIEYSWQEFPKASLVTGTMRESLLPKCFEQFENQTYPKRNLY